MRVKALEWFDYDESWWTAEHGLLRIGYEVRETGRGPVRLRMPGEGWDYFDGTISAAKDHCQKDFERRVMSALAE